jgi:hypothetical protein
MQSNQNIHDLLIEHQNLNKKRILAVSQDKELQQTVSPPVALPDVGIPSLARGVYKRITPMIKARFEYASNWKNADAGLDWLSVQEMEQAATDAKLIEMVNSRIDSWDGTPLKGVSFSQLSLFGVNREQEEEVYLLWPIMAGQEPAIISYTGNFESKFADFGTYLQHLISGN